MGTENSDKPLDRMTVKELREVAKEIPEITGVHGRNKAELLVAIKEARGFKEAPKKSNRSVRSLKKAIKTLRKQQEKAGKANDKKMATIFRRKISRLKKKTRNAA